MPLKVFKRNKLYSYRGTVAGRRLRGPTGTADKRVAERIAAEVETKAWQSHLDGPGATLTFAQAAIAYRQAVHDDRFLDRVEDYWKGTLVPKITGEAIRQMARKLYPGAANATSNRKPDSLVFQYASGESVGQVWNNVIERAGIEKLSPHCCRHGFATSMLQAGIDPKTVAVRGGWKDVGTVMKFYAHAMDDPTVTDVLFGTK